MAMVACKECKAEISSKAEACPQCGAKIRRTSWAVKLLVVIIGGSVLVGVFLSNGAAEQRAAVEAAKTPEQRAAEAEAKKRDEAEFQRAVAYGRAIKASMKNPASFELSTAILTADGALCLAYRGTNSFNAVVPGYAVVPAKGKAASGSMSDVAQSWDKHCSGKTGKDMRYIRMAL